MSIARKLALLVTVPLVAALLAAGVAIWVTVGQAVQAGRARSLVVTASHAGDVAARLQAERVAAADVLTLGSSKAMSTYLDRIAATDTSAAAMDVSRSQLSDVPAGASALLERIAGQQRVLDTLRAQVQARVSIALSSVAVQYRIAIAAMLNFRAATAQVGVSADLADQIRAAAALSKAAEYAGEQQVAVLRALGARELSPAAVEEITATRTGYTSEVQNFSDLAAPGWRPAMDQALAGPGIMAARQLEDVVGRTPAGNRLDVDRATWNAAMDLRLAKLHEVERNIDAQITSSVTERRDTQIWWAGAVATAVLFLAAGVVTLAMLIGKPMVRRLRTVTVAAKKVAYETLPQSVELLQSPSALQGRSPAEFADSVAASMPALGRDEVGQVAQAFAEVFRAALRAAAQQALEHSRQQKMFVSLARRGNTLTSLAVQLLDAVERTELDPKRLDSLYRLDSLVTRMENNHIGLLLLGGQAQGLVRTADEPLIQVLQGAVSRVEEFERIDTRAVAADVVIDRRWIDQLVYLFGVLLDNATRYSPPETSVVVSGEIVGDQVSVRIADRGLGIPREQMDDINSRLATPRPLGADDVAQMGLLVVAHIAATLRIKVELRAHLNGGTVAVVDLPASLLVMTAPAEQIIPPALQPTEVGAAEHRPGPAIPRQRRPSPAHAAPALAATAAATMEMPYVGTGLAPHQPSGPDGLNAELRFHPSPAEQTRTRNGLPRRQPASTRPEHDPNTGPIAPAGPRDPALIAGAMAAFAHGTGAGIPSRPRIAHHGQGAPS